MNQKELKELIEFLIEKDIAEFELERGDVKVRIKRGAEPSGGAVTPETRYFAMHSAPPAEPVGLTLERIPGCAGTALVLSNKCSPLRRRLCTWCVRRS